jgi:AGZA family xanthine/uracil permease-like MFS transporter
MREQRATIDPPPSALERFFQVRERHSSIGTEVRGGLTTFVVMSYILFVNPVILAVLTQGRGPDVVATATMTALTAGVMTLLMGLYANYPLALAPGMGLNAFVAFDLIVGRGLPWQTAMGVVFIEGAIITVLVLTGFREAVLWAIPLNLKRAIGVGIGFFILFIGLVNAGFVRVPVETLSVVDGRVVGLLTGWPVFVAVFGLFFTAVLLARRVRGALLLGIVVTTLVALAIHALTGADVSAAPGVQGALPTQLPPISFATFGAGLNLDIFTALPLISAVLIVFSIMLSDFFDTMGTVIGIGSEAGWLDAQGRLPNIQRVLLVDGLAAAFGGIASASSVTTYVESAAGVAEGARTGLASVVTGLLFLVAIVFAPLAGLVPAEATAPALIIVGFYMAAVLRDIEFVKLEEGLPALLTIVVMPVTYSITDGIGAGFIMWTFLRVVTGRWREVHWMMYVVSAAFLLYFALALLRSLFGW